MSAPVIDAHQHFWDPEGAYDYPWLSGPFAPIRRAFCIDDLRPSLEEFGVDGTVVVQSWNSLDETWDYLRIAGANRQVAGVVGWADLTDPAIGTLLAELKNSTNGRYLVGIRHLLHEEPDPAWILRDDVARGLAALAEAGLVYDLVGKTVHLPAMLQAVERNPGLRFVLDHLAKPEIKDGVFEPWGDRMAALAAHRDHVWCKLSGMITEADWDAWTPDHLAPYVRHALAAFGPDRCMFGTDWPVCLVAGSYGQVVGALRACLAGTDETVREQIFGRSAIEAYRLPDFTA